MFVAGRFAFLLASVNGAACCCDCLIAAVACSWEWSVVRWPMSGIHCMLFVVRCLWLASPVVGICALLIDGPPCWRLAGSCHVG